MTYYAIREFQKEDIKLIGYNARQADRDELWAAYHMTPAQCLRTCYLALRNADNGIICTGTAEGVPVCSFGVKYPTSVSKLAQPWMIGTDKVQFYSRAFLRYSKQIVDIWKDNFPYLVNYVDARNTDTIRWLQWVGFSVYYPEPYGVDQLPFHRFDTEA